MSHSFKDFGISILSAAVSAKAPPPIFSSDFESFIFFNEAQPPKAYAPISVTVSGISKLTILFFSNALLPILVTVYPSISEGIYTE